VYRARKSKKILSFNLGISFAILQPPITLENPRPYLFPDQLYPYQWEEQKFLFDNVHALLGDDWEPAKPL